MTSIIREDLIGDHKRQNVIQSFLLLTAMFGLMALAGGMLFGWDGVAAAFVMGLVFLWLGARQSTRIVLRMYGALRLDEYRAPRLVWLVRELSRRAGLAKIPELYYVPSAMLNAFAVGRRDDPAIALTDGLLRSLSVREVAGVLAHELSHIRNNDMFVMGLADTLSRLTHMFSVFGQVLLFINLPFLLFGQGMIPILPIILLILAPTVSGLLQLALSRTREYNADIEAVRISGDAQGLAAALEKLEQAQGGFFERILLPGRRTPEPSLLRTHPPTAERVRRLLAYAGIERPRSLPPRLALPDFLECRDCFPPVARGPRWRISGLWY